MTPEHEAKAALEEAARIVASARRWQRASLMSCIAGIALAGWNALTILLRVCQ